MSGGKILDRIEIDLRDIGSSRLHTIYIDVFDNSLSRKWLLSLNDILKQNNHLEKNYCFMGFVESQRDGPFILDQINQSIQAINQASIGYEIDDWFDMTNCMSDDVIDDRSAGRNIVHHKFNQLHRYFEDLQGVSGRLSPYYQKADTVTRWHIRQLNLLCHEFESWAMSYRKQVEAPEWQRPSQLMCWLNAPRFVLDPEDLEFFGIETMNRPLGGVFVGVNKAVGKHHWEVFNDEGRDSRIDELVTTTLRTQTEAAGDFDIEWANNPGEYHWQKVRLDEFRQWLINNGFDPNDPSLTIGHPRVAQVDLPASFGTSDYQHIWAVLAQHLDVYAIRTSQGQATYQYHWSDRDYQQLQIEKLQ